MRDLRTIVLTAAICLIGLRAAWAQTATPEEVQSPLLVLRNLPHAPSHDRIQVRHYDFKELGAPSEYQLFVSSKYNPNKPAPFILALHCLQCPPSDFIRYADLTELAEARGYIVAAPMGVNLHGWWGSRGNTIAVTGPRPGRGGEPPAPPDPANLGDLSEQDAMNVFEIVRKEFNIDPNRMYLMGHSMGGGGTWYLGMKHPDLWAALAVADPAINGGIENLSRIKDTPVFVVQGDADRLVPVARTRQWVDAMKSLGMTYEYIEVPGGDHMTPLGRTPENMRKMFDFLDKYFRKSQR